MRRCPQTRVRAQRRTLAPGARQPAQPIARSRVAPERSNATLPTNSGARAAPHARAGARAKQLSRLPAAPRRRMSGAMRRCPQTRVRAQRRTLRAGRAPSSSADCPELKRAKSLGRTDHDQPIRWRTYESRPNGRVLSTGFSASGPAPPSEPGQTRVSSRAPQAPRVPSRAGRARKRHRNGFFKSLRAGFGSQRGFRAGVRASTPRLDRACFDYGRHGAWSAAGWELRSLSPWSMAEASPPRSARWSPRGPCGDARRRAAGRATARRPRARASRRALVAATAAENESTVPATVNQIQRRPAGAGRLITRRGILASFCGVRHAEQVIRRGLARRAKQHAAAQLAILVDRHEVRLAFARAHGAR